MGNIRPFVPARLVAGMLLADPGLQTCVEQILVHEFGPITLSSTLVPFSWTNYYNGEMGTNIQRYFIEFEDLVDPAGLASIKIRTNAIEDLFGGPTGRQVNIDPGLLSADNLILATTKDRSHRIPLSDGIFAEVTLMYYGGQFQALPWTYADYRSDDIRQLFKQLRQRYLTVLRKDSPRTI